MERAIVMHFCCTMSGSVNELRLGIFNGSLIRGFTRFNCQCFRADSRLLCPTVLREVRRFLSEKPRMVHLPRWRQSNMLWNRSECREVVRFTTRTGMGVPRQTDVRLGERTLCSSLLR